MILKLNIYFLLVFGTPQTFFETDFLFWHEHLKRTQEVLEEEQNYGLCFPSSTLFDWIHKENLLSLSIRYSLLNTAMIIRTIIGKNTYKFIYLFYSIIEYVCAFSLSLLPPHTFRTISRDYSIYRKQKTVLCRKTQFCSRFSYFFVHRWSVVFARVLYQHTNRNSLFP